MRIVSYNVQLIRAIKCLLLFFSFSLQRIVILERTYIPCRLIYVNYGIIYTHTIDGILIHWRKTLH